MFYNIETKGVISGDTLRNGVKVFYEYIPNATHVVSLCVYIKAGSRYETEKNNGISHFVEHMLFRGTDKYDSAQINKIIDSLGGHTNAFTSREFTGVFTSVTRDSFDIALDLISQLVKYPTFKDEDIKKERPVVLEELKMFDEREDKASDNLYHKCYGNSGVGLDIIGTEENINSFNKWDLMEYHGKMYVPDNALISLAGDFDNDCVIKLLQEFGFWIPTVNILSDEPKKYDVTKFIEYPDGENIVTEQVDSNNIYMIEAIPTQIMFDNMPAAQVFSTIFSQGMTSMLFTKIREELGLCYSISGGVSYVSDFATMQIHCECNPENFTIIKNEITKILEDLKDNGVSEDKLNEAIKSTINKRALIFQKVDDECHRIARGNALFGECLTHDEFSELIKKTTVDDIKNIATELCERQPIYSIAGDVENLK